MYLGPDEILFLSMLAKTKLSGGHRAILDIFISGVYYEMLKEQSFMNICIEYTWLDKTSISRKIADLLKWKILIKNEKHYELNNDYSTWDQSIFRNTKISRNEVQVLNTRPKSKRGRKPKSIVIKPPLFASNQDEPVKLDEQIKLEEPIKQKLEEPVLIAETIEKEEIKEEKPVTAQTNKVKPAPKVLKTFPLDSNEVILSELLLAHIKNNLPGYKGPDDIQKWARTMDLILRLDKRKVEEVIEVIEWCQSDTFWKSNILSVESLRKQYDKLNAQRLMRQNNKGVQVNESNMDKRRAKINREIFEEEEEFAAFFK